MGDSDPPPPAPSSPGPHSPVPHRARSAEKPAALIYLRTLCCVRDGERVLLLRRRKAPNQGRLNFPGGKIEPVEDPYDACLREVYEETGLRIRGAMLRAILTVITRTTGAQWLLFVFVADRQSEPPDPVRTDEGELQWVPASAVPGLHVVSDIPLILPHLLSRTPGVLMGRIHCDNDDVDSMLDHELRLA